MTTAAPAAPTVTGEVAAARRQLVLYYAGAYDPDDQVEVRFIKAGADARSEWYTAAELPDAVDRLARANAAGWNVYLGANPRVGRGPRGDDAVKLARCVFADFDGPTVDGVLAKLAALGLPKPSLVVATGHGVHVYWRLETAQEDLAEWVGFQKDLIAHLGSDPRIFNPERIMRAPGFST